MIKYAIRQFASLATSPGAGGFALRLLLFWSPLPVLLALGPVRRAIEEPLEQAYAWAVSLVLDLLGVEHVRKGVELIYPGQAFSFRIDPECTGFGVFWFFVGAVLAFPATWASRLIAIASGAVLLFATNVVRIVSLYYIRIHHEEWFDELHLVVWQSLVIILVGVFWYAWASTRPARTATPA